MTNQFSFLDYIASVRRNLRLFLVIITSFALFSIIISFMLPISYKAMATLLPLSSNDSSSQLAGFSGVASLITGQDANAAQISRLLAILQSRSLVAQVIEKNKLMPILYPDLWNEKEKKWKVSADQIPTLDKAISSVLHNYVTFSQHPTAPLIVVVAEFHQPETSSAVANSYVDELQRYTTHNVLTSAQQRVVYLKRELEGNTENLLEVGQEVSQLYGSKNYADQSATFQISLDPDATSFGDLEQQVKKLDGGIAAYKKVPQQVYLSYLVLKRETLAKINALLHSQYELAKADQQKESLSFQVLDAAYVPYAKAFPNRLLIFIIGSFLGFFVASFACFWRFQKAASL